MRGIFFTKDGLRSVPQDIPGTRERPLRNLSRPVMERVSNVVYSKAIESLGPSFTKREYEFTKFVEWFDGDEVAYYCEI